MKSHQEQNQNISYDQAENNQLLDSSVTLSKNALKDLRSALCSSYGNDLDNELSDEQVNKLGELFLTILVESLQLEVTVS